MGARPALRGPQGRGRAPGLLLLAFAARRFDQHTKWALLLAVLVLGALVLQPPLADRLRRRGIPA